MADDPVPNYRDRLVGVINCCGLVSDNINRRVFGYSQVSQFAL